MYTGHCEDNILWKCTTAQQVLTERPHVLSKFCDAQAFTCVCVFVRVEFAAFKLR